jgi:predicted dehydrogenase
MKGKAISFGIIGCGLMGRELASAMARWCHLLDLNVRPELVAVCDRAPALLDWFTSNFDTVHQATADYRELLANPKVEAVYCAVPHNLHQQMYVDILNAGKHLLGEKPFGIDRAANRAILAAAARHPQAVVRASSEFPFFPVMQRIIRLIKDRKFGKILEVECGFLHSSDMNPDKPINWKRMVDVNGEYGCMGDLGLHVFHVPLRFGWTPANVRAILSKVVRERPNASGQLVPCETWDNATLFCEVPCDGEVFPLTAKTQRMAPGETNTWYLTIKGTELSARFTTKRPKTLETMPYVKTGPQTWHSEDVGYEPEFKTITGGIFEFGFSDSLLQMLAAFCRQIELGNQGELFFGCATLEETRLSHEIFTAALESQKNKSVVKIG